MQADSSPIFCMAFTIFFFIDIINGRNFGFRIDTDEYAYMLRLNPNKGEYNAYIYAYDREMLDMFLEPQQEVQQEGPITVLVVEPEKVPYVKEIDPGLKSLQSEVDGWIEAVYPFEDPVAIICNEEGKMNGLPLNRALIDDDSGEIYDIVAGTFLVTGLTEDNFGSLNEEQIKKFIERFRHPEAFLQMGKHINTWNGLPLQAVLFFHGGENYRNHTSDAPACRTEENCR